MNRFGWTFITLCYSFSFFMILIDKPSLENFFMLIVCLGLGVFCYAKVIKFEDDEDYL